MTQDYVNKIQGYVGKFLNMKFYEKLFIIVGVVLVIGVAAWVFTSETGGGLSGRYESATGSSLEFIGGNRVKLYGVVDYDTSSGQVTYKLSGNQISLETTYDNGDTRLTKGTVSADKREIVINERVYVKK
ncbi:MAG: hypothetical protein FWD52_06690 [Candidatus Bathyarchaeota archaeon]|nr:hypothetical protein [Candidatus Termiticorpusculum sp.]